MKSKKQITAHAPKSVDEFNALVNACALLQLAQEQDEAALNKLLADTGADIRAAIEKRTAEITAHISTLHAFAHLHRDELFGKKKSAETTQATFGFADNPTALKLLGKDHTEETVVAALRVLGKPQFVRVAEEVNREGIKEALREAALMEDNPDKPADWKPAITVTELRMCGLRLQQGERFFLQPKRAAESENPKISTL